MVGVDIKKFEQSVIRKNFDLTEREFNELLNQLQNGNAALFEKVFLAHFRRCMKYLMDKHNASYTDSYDVTMETLIQFQKRLKDGKVSYGNMSFLFTQMAKQNYIRWAKKNLVVSDMEGIEIEEETEEFDESTMVLLDQAWEHLGSNCQSLLKDFYYKKISLNKIAELTNKSHQAIRKQKQRCMDKLRSVFVELYQE